jgi:lactate dehydrogenase-like 2-hydroxyacid dehydrogenase
MSKITLLALGAIPAPEMSLLETQYDVIKLWREPDPEQTLQTRGRDVRAVLSNAAAKWQGVSAKMMDALPNLEVITQFGVGYDNIDVVEAKKRQIAVTNTPDVLTNDTADTALALMLGVMRRVVEGDMFVRTGKWLNGALPLGHALAGKTVGVVGLGRIGSAIARRCAAFDMQITYHGRTPKENVAYRYNPDLVEMAGDVDVLILACAGGPATVNLVSRAVIGAMKPSAFLINISRGSVVDQDALVEALANRKIAGAGLDVFTAEPNVPDELKAMDNVVMTPHIGSATVETRSAMGRLVLDNLAAHFDGRPLLTPVAA